MRPLTVSALPSSLVSYFRTTLSANQGLFAEIDKIDPEPIYFVMTRMRPRYVAYVRKISILIFVLFAILVIHSYHRRSGKPPQKARTEKILTPGVTRSTERIEFTESRGGREVFKIEALKHVEQTEGRNILQQVTAYNFGREAERKDVIQSDYCEYNQAKNTILFNGNVIVRVTGGMEIRSGSLRYDKSSETASTAERFSLRDKQLEGGGQGLVYHFSTKDFNVHQDVDLSIKSTPPEPASTRIQARSAMYQQAQRVLTLSGGVAIKQGTNSLESQMAHLYFSSDDKVEHLQASGNASYRVVTQDGGNELKGRAIKIEYAQGTSDVKKVEAEESASFASKSSTEQNLLTAQRISIRLAENRPTFLEALNQVTVQSLGGGSKFELSGETFLASFKKESGTALDKMTVRTHAKLRSIDSTSPSNDLAAETIDMAFTDSKNGLKEIDAAGGAIWHFAAAPKAGETSPVKTLKAQSVKTSYQEDGKSPKQLQARNDCSLEIPPTGATKKRKVISADGIDATFYPGSTQINQFVAERNVKVTAEPNDRKTPPTVTRSDKLIAHFDASDQIKAFEQTGHFRYEEGKRKATSERAFQEEAKGLIHLTGKPVVWDETTRTLAENVTIDRERDQLRASGHVRTIHRSGGPDTLTTPFSTTSKEPILIISDHLEVDDKEGTAVYWGSPRASQEGDLVQAETIEIFNRKQEFVAQKNVRSIFYLKNQKGNPADQNPSPATVRSDKMTYFQEANMARYETNVTVLFNETVMKAELADLFFDKEDNKVEKVVLERNVHVKQPDREGSGTRAEYYAEEDKTILVGTLAEIQSKTKGKSTGKRLTFYNNGDRIFIDSR